MEKMLVSIKQQQNLYESHIKMQGKFSRMTTQSHQTMDVMDKDIRKQTQVDGLIQKNKNNLNSLKNDVTNVKAEIKTMKQDHNDMATRTDTSKDLI